MSRMVILLAWRLICSYRPYRLTLYFNYLIINLKAYYKFFKGKHKLCPLIRISYLYMR
jgi:hypothetical protein